MDFNDDEKIRSVVFEVGHAAIRLMMNSNSITNEMLIDELERYRKEVTNTLHKGALRDAAQMMRHIKG
ncbi:hypothetical protein AB7309_08305 [Providencia manganoxydans]|uniref:hypothetical protein n=1 Tax=Providencia manganoxydans TaxID=2923283 RepID=UPI0034E450AF